MADASVPETTAPGPTTPVAAPPVPPAPVLTDGVVTLRPPTPGDVEALVRAWTDPVRARWVPRPVDPAKIRARITAGPDGRGYGWVAVDGSGALVGDLDLTWTQDEGPVSRDRRTNIGWSTAPGHRGHGYATRMARLATDWALGEGGCTTVVASVTATNLASRITALDAGMRPEAVLVAGGDDSEATVRPAEHTYVRDGEPIPPQPVLHCGDGVELRPWRVRDAAAVHDWVHDPDTLRFTYVPHPYPDGAELEYAGPATREGWATGAGISWAVHRGGRIVGSVSTRRLAPGVRDVGVTVAPAARGFGTIPSAVDAVCRWLFAETDTVRVEWDASADNTSSIRAAQKAGFTFETVRRATFRKRDGTRGDNWVGVRLRP